MLFVEPKFLLFFAVVFSIYWSMPWKEGRKLLLLVSSYVFYASWDWRFLGLIVLSTSVDYFAAERIHRTHRPLARKAWLTLSIVTNLSILGFFKYFNFFRDSAVDFMATFGQTLNPLTLDIVLPVGISFFTFQSMSYTIDVYRRRIDTANSRLDFFLYVAFFPQLVAGPIVRAKAFLPQLSGLRRFPRRRFPALAALFAVGFFKKVAISDNIARFIDPVFADPSAWDGAAGILAAVLFSVQLYCDFSGYSDMAIAIAGLLGFRLLRNFDAPFFSRSMIEFWHRWHISLSTWLRDYLYFSLGGSRRGEFRTYVNLMITMTLAGIWHGASWNFVIMGVLYGSSLCVNRFWRLYRMKAAGGIAAMPPPAAATVSGYLLTGLSIMATFTWFTAIAMLFRTVTIHDTAAMIVSIVQWSSVTSLTLPHWLWGPLVILGGVHYLSWRYDLVRRTVLLPHYVSALLVGAVFALALAFMSQETVPFIYFQF